MSNPEDDAVLDSMSFLAELRREAKRIPSGYLKALAAEAPRDMLLLYHAGWTTANGGRDWRSPYDGRELPLAQAADRERERRACLRAEANQEQSMEKSPTAAISLTSEPFVAHGGVEDVRRMLRDAIQYLDRGEASSDLARAEESCGRRLTKLAVIELVSWLEYISRGGRSRDSLPLNESPLSAMRCLFAQDLSVRDFFAIEGNSLVWRQGASAEVRAAAVAYVGENYHPRIRE